MDGAGTPLRTLWFDGALRFADQRELPERLHFARAADADGVSGAIESGALAGARCLATAGAFAAAFVRRSNLVEDARHAALARLHTAIGSTGGAASDTPPLDGIRRVLAAPPGSEIAAAQAVFDECVRIDKSIARHVASLLTPNATVLTHGSSGAFTSGGGEGTALGGILAAVRDGRRIEILITEGRPRAGGRRLAAVECAAAGAAYTVIADAAAAAAMRTEPIAAVIVGAHAMRANGDTLADLGTYALAVAAAHHRIPLYVALPRAAIAHLCTDGDRPILANAASAYDAATSGNDETPGRLITAVITEYGVSQPPYDASLAALATRPHFVFTNSREVFTNGR